MAVARIYDSVTAVTGTTLYILPRYWR